MFQQLLCHVILVRIGVEEVVSLSYIILEQKELVGVFLKKIMEYFQGYE